MRRRDALDDAVGKPRVGVATRVAAGLGVAPRDDLAGRGTRREGRVARLGRVRARARARARARVRVRVSVRVRVWVWVWVWEGECCRS